MRAELRVPVPVPVSAPAPAPAGEVADDGDWADDDDDDEKVGDGQPLSPVPVPPSEGDEATLVTAPATVFCALLVVLRNIPLSLPCIDIAAFTLAFSP